VAAERAFERIFRGIDRERSPALGRAQMEAWHAFAERGLPTTGEEDWRFTSLAPLEDIDFAAPPSSALPERAPLPAAQIAAARARVGAGRLLVIADSHFRPEDSERSGISAESLLQGRLALGSLLDAKLSPFSALNTALLGDGVRIDVAAGEPTSIHLLHWLSDGPPRALNPRACVTLRAGASATLVEHFIGAPGSRSLSNSATDLVIERGAQLRYVQLQELPESAFHVSTVVAEQDSDSRLELASIALGGRIARVEIQATLSGERAELDLNGLYLGRGAQHQDHHTTVDHASPRTTSRELFKGILDGRAHGVFHGRVHVRPDAQKIDAAQTNRTLLLSDGAVIDSKPQLEIYADDVKCSHGASVGQLDPDQIFYLRARGLDLERARALLTFAFASEVLGKLPLQTLRESLERGLLAWLPLGGAP
jgi:Fe-S cluster assembly protein SufD